MLQQGTTQGLQLLAHELKPSAVAIFGRGLAACEGFGKPGQIQSLASWADSATVCVGGDEVIGGHLTAIDQCPGTALDQVTKRLHQIGGKRGVAPVRLVIEAQPRMQTFCLNEAGGAGVEHGIAQ